MHNDSVAINTKSMENIQKLFTYLLGEVQNMSPELASTIQAFSGALTLLVAIVSIVIALRAEKRNHDRFHAELDLSRNITSATIRPIVLVYSQVTDIRKSIILVNRGIGPAIITSFEMKRGDKSVNNMKDLFDIGDDVIWEKWRRLPNEQIILSPGQEIILVKLTKQYLIAQGCTDEQAESVLASWQQQKTGIDVCFNYEDALGNKQYVYSTTLR